MRTAIYARVSTRDKDQDADNQLLVLREFCGRMGYTVINEYVDEVSGSTSDRAAFKALFADAAKRRFDLVLFWSLDRFSREGARATIRHLEQLEGYGVSFRSYTEHFIDSCGIFKDVIISMLSTLAKQERIRLSERVKAGLARTSKKGGRPTIPTAMIEEVRRLKAEGLSNRRIGAALNLSHSTIGLYLR
ncbi:MAG: recombinase family protein [Sphingobacteriales bacterium]|nr:MAG: recombinase family protein [Sphingobacteriales bacterium]